MAKQRMVMVVLVASMGFLLVRVDAAVPSELEVENLREGKPCDNPTKTGDSIYVHYDAKLHPELGGKEFESTKGKKPYKFQLGSGREISGWDLGLLDMCPGATRKITVPPKYGYDAGTKKGVPAAATVVFTMELVSIEENTWAKSWAGIQIIVVACVACTIWITIWKGTSDSIIEPKGPKSAYRKL